MVRELANLSFVKRMLSRSEESRIRQLPFPALQNTSFGGRGDEAEKVVEEGRHDASHAFIAHQRSCGGHRHRFKEQFRGGS